MELLERYLQAVKFWLPKEQKSDIIAELSEDLRSQIEERETAVGRKLSEVISAAAHDVQKIASKGLSTAELEEFYRLARLMTENLNAERRG